jgi:hypothetical protein
LPKEAKTKQGEAKGCAGHFSIFREPYATIYLENKMAAQNLAVNEFP